MDLFGWKTEPVDPAAMRAELTRTDPDFAHVREVQHDALNTLGASKTSSQVRDRFNERLRDSWRPTP